MHHSVDNVTLKHFRAKLPRTLRSYCEQHSPLRDAVTLSLIEQLLEGIVFLHQHKAEHGFLQFDDLMIGEPRDSEFPRLFITGYGFGCFPDMLIAKTNNSMPPAKVLDNIKGRRNKRRASDVWAVGIVLFELITGRHPFDGKVRCLFKDGKPEN